MPAALHTPHVPRRSSRCEACREGTWCFVVIGPVALRFLCLPCWRVLHPVPPD
jgi:hypothetical protein